jgi:hypothetical protein
MWVVLCYQEEEKEEIKGRGDITFIHIISKKKTCVVISYVVVLSTHKQDSHLR